MNILSNDAIFGNVVAFGMFMNIGNVRNNK